MFTRASKLGDVINLKLLYPKGGIAQDKKGQPFCFWNITGPKCDKPDGWDDACRVPKGVTMKGFPNPQDRWANLDGVTIKAELRVGGPDAPFETAQVFISRAKQFSDEWVVTAYPSQSSPRELLEFVGTVDNLKDLLGKFFYKNHPVFDVPF
jgi:hypothetical protein